MHVCSGCHVIVHLSKACLDANVVKYRLAQVRVNGSTVKRRAIMNTVFCLETNNGIDVMGSSSVVLLFGLFH